MKSFCGKPVEDYTRVKKVVEQDKAKRAMWPTTPLPWPSTP